MNTTLLRQVKLAQNASEGRWTIEVSSTNPNVYTTSFIPSEGSVYAERLHFVDITFPAEFPFYAPRMCMTTKIFHPNVATKKGHEGNMYVEILYSDWTPAFTVTKLLEYLHGLFSKPDLDSLSICNDKAGRLYKDDREQFNKTATEWVRLYAI